ncbi:MAG: extracellular solute-binding protein [Actinobacteria bacterium]|nr:extracellular solute-binding protein [Actinomycetota bacterium]
MSDTPTQHLIERYEKGKISRRSFISRGVALGLSIPTLSILLEACGAGSSGSSSELHLLMEDVDETTYVENVLPAFEKQTGVKVSIERIVYEAMHDKLVPQLSAGKGQSAYDLIQVDVPWTKEFADAGWMVDLSSNLSASKEVALKEFVPTVVASNGYVDGKPYMVPFYHYAYGLSFRKDVLADAKIADAFEKKYHDSFALPTTLTDFQRYSQFISDLEGRSTLAGTVMLAKRGENGLEWMNYLYANGGDFIRGGKSLVTEPQAVESLEIYKELLNNASQPGANNAAFDEGMTTMEAGKGATWMIYLWMTTALNASKSPIAGKMELARIPGTAGVMAAWGWAIPTASSKQEAAWELMQYLASEPVSLERALMGSEPARTAVYENPKVLAKYPEFKLHHEIALHSKIYPEQLRNSAATEYLGLQVYEATSGQKSAESALQAFAEKYLT